SQASQNHPENSVPWRGLCYRWIISMTRSKVSKRICRECHTRYSLAHLGGRCPSKIESCCYNRASGSEQHSFRQCGDDLGDGHQGWPASFTTVATVSPMDRWCDSGSRGPGDRHYSRSRRAFLNTHFPSRRSV